MRWRSYQLVMLAVVLLVPAAGLAAVHVVQVDQGWQYAPADDPPDIEKLPAAWEPVELPRKLGTEPCGLYRARVALPMAWAGRRIVLVVRRSRGTVRAWADGKALGVRSPSALDVRLDVTGVLLPGAAHALVVAVSDPDSLQRPGLAACRLEATEAIGITALDIATWRFAQGAVVDVHATVRNGGYERLDSRLLTDERLYRLDAVNDIGAGARPRRPSPFDITLFFGIRLCRNSALPRNRGARRRLSRIRQARAE